MGDNDIVTVQEVARELGRSIEQIRRYLREGKLSGRKLGQQWFVERRALERFKAPDASSVPDPLGEAKAVRERIRARAGLFDTVELVNWSRRRNS